LVPALATVIQTGFGIEKGKFDIKDISANGSVRIDAQRTGRDQNKTLVLTWAPESVAADYDFATTGKPLDFSDAIREAIYAKLREAIENGETWAEEALKGKKSIVVEFTVAQQKAARAQKLEVKSVYLKLRDAADELAHSLGLVEGEYLLVNEGSQMMVVLEKGKVGTLRIGDKFVQIKSPDGDAKIFVKQNRAKNDVSILLMLSRQSLDANQDAIVRLTGNAALQKINQAVLGNPTAEQFLVRVDPNAEETLIIKPIAAPAKDK
jgi:hypothetical protein